MLRAVVPITLVILLVSTTSVNVAVAGDDDTPTDAPGLAPGRSGSGAMRGLAAGARAAPPKDALRLVACFRVDGGPKAVEGLQELAQHRDASVRAAAFEALAQVGIRTRVGLELARKAAISRIAAERQAGLEALGTLGDGSDLELLLGGLRACDGNTRTAAYQALRQLTGVLLPVSPARCRQRCAALRRRGERAVEAALHAIGTAGPCDDIQEHQETLERYGWIDLVRTEEMARYWLQMPHAHLRATACRLIAVYRLADLSDDLDGSLPHLKEAYAKEALHAARVLGIPTDRVSPHILRTSGSQ